MRKPPSRVVVIGDLNGADDALEELLIGTGLVDEKLRWIGGEAELVQMGDLFNRGDGALRAFRLLLGLQREAPRAGGRVTVLLGNHEAMTALRHEGYCTEGEYLSFATAKERRAWPEQVRRALQRLVRQRSPRGPILPLEPRLDAWKIQHVPGRSAMRRSLGARGKIGRALRALPVVHRTLDTIFVHGGLRPEWAELGVDAINARAAEEWRTAPSTLWSLPRSSLFRDPKGPLWDRSLTHGSREASRDVQKTLSLLGAERMIVGHTPTEHAPGGTEGEILMLHGGRLVLVDVGIRSGKHAPRAALILTAQGGYQWTPGGTRSLWGERRLGKRL